MKLFIFILFLGITGISQAQKAKIKIDGDIVLVDNTPVFQLEEKGFPKSFTLYSMQNVQLATFETNFISKMVRQSDGSYKDVRNYYFLVKFNDSEQSSCEMSSFGIKKQFANFILTNLWVQNGELNEPVIKKFCQEAGFSYSNPRKKPTTIKGR
jgi:hypothetical protein